MPRGGIILRLILFYPVVVAQLSPGVPLPGACSEQAEAANA
jgi:hypothetical protein